MWKRVAKWAEPSWQRAVDAKLRSVLVPGAPKESVTQCVPEHVPECGEPHPGGGHVETLGVRGRRGEVALRSRGGVGGEGRGRRSGLAHPIRAPPPCLCHHHQLKA